MDKIEIRGGARPGAGRPSVEPDDLRVQLSVSVAPETKRMLQELRSRGVRTGRLIDDLVGRYFAESGK